MLVRFITVNSQQRDDGKRVGLRLDADRIYHVSPDRYDPAGLPFVREIGEMVGRSWEMTFMSSIAWGWPRGHGSKSVDPVPCRSFHHPTGMHGTP